MAEAWRPILGFEEAYEISDLGGVRSVCRTNAYGRRLSGRILRGGLVKGHYQVTLRKNGESKSIYVHVAVLEAFVCKRPKGRIACHFDGNGLNNSLSNLYWGTHGDNTEDALRHGAYRSGETSHLAKLSASEVDQIKSLAANASMSQRAMARLYGVSDAAISRIVNGKAWRFADAAGHSSPALDAAEALLRSIAEE